MEAIEARQLLTLALLGRAYINHMLKEHNTVQWLGAVPMENEIRQWFNNLEALISDYKI